MESSDKTWSNGERNGKPLQFSCGENPTNSMKMQKDMRPGKISLLRLEGVQHAKEKSGGQLLIAPERMKHLGQSGNDP